MEGRTAPSFTGTRWPTWPVLRIQTGAPTADHITLQGPGWYAGRVRQVDGTYARTAKDGTVSQFQPAGLFTSLHDRERDQTTYGA